MKRNRTDDFDLMDNHDGLADESGEQMVPVDSATLRQTPWFAVSVSFHAVLLLVVWSLVMAETHEEQVNAVPAAVEPVPLPPPPPVATPVIRPQDPHDKVPVETEENITFEEATDRHNEDPTNNPDERDLRPNPTPSEAMNNADRPITGTTAIGVGALAGGGTGGPSGSGGLDHRRSGPGISGTPVEANILAALRWLADHQNPNGSWDPDGFASAATGTRTRGAYGNLDGSIDTGWSDTDAGVSGLALLAFLGAGCTHYEGEFANTVKRGLRYLRAIQDTEGCFDVTMREREHFMYGHAICTMAMAEAYGMTGSAVLRGPAQFGVDFIAESQNNDTRGYRGWRYRPDSGENDASVTGWMALALKSARMAGLMIPEHCWAGSIELMNELTTEVAGYPKTGYRRAGTGNARMQANSNFLPNGSLDAINLITRLAVTGDGSLRNEPPLRSQAYQLTLPESLPTTDDPDRIDYYYWYYASMALYQMGGRAWDTWAEPMFATLAGSQRLDGDETSRCYGSWDSSSCWGHCGGRVYATAINCLTLEVTIRYERIGQKHD